VPAKENIAQAAGMIDVAIARQLRGMLWCVAWRETNAPSNRNVTLFT
jgi:hypothetical protein